MGTVAAITPPPGYAKAVAEGQSNIVVGALTTKGSKGKKSVTPVPPSGDSKNKKEKKKEVSKDALAVHQRWQNEAEKMGGPGVKIVVSKAVAKPMIFNMMHDSFRPMNITEIHHMGKAIVPGPIVKSCLEDMADTFQGNPFADNDSDDEDEENKKPKKAAKKTSTSNPSDEYCGSLRVKEGRNSNATLYYVDYTKLSNQGNGLDPEKRNDLYADLEKAKCEEAALRKQLNDTNAEAARLLCEPLNEELARLLVENEKEMEDLNDKLQTNRAFAGNEKHAKSVNGNISKMAAIWRKSKCRVYFIIIALFICGSTIESIYAGKRMCMDFLMFMEESTDGMILFATTFVDNLFQLIFCD